MSPNQDEIEAKERKSRAEEVIEAQTRIYGSLYDKAAMYTNLVTALGYAGLFGLWSLTKEFLNKQDALVSAILLMLSIVSFVSFEVFKTAIVAHATRKRVNALFGGNDGQSHDLDAFVAKLQKVELENHRHELQMVKVWWIAWVIAVLSGLGAVVVLMAAFIRGLL